MQPHTYVLWTMSGQEEKMVKMLHTANVVEEREPIKTEAGITIPSSYETLFIPKAEFVKRYRGVDQPITQDLYPGYIFLSTPTPVNFFKRLRDVYFLRETGKEVKMLRPQGVNTKASVSSTDTIEDIEKKMAEYIQQIDDDEEKEVLRLCRLRRNEQGDIVPFSTVKITEQVKDKLVKAGLNPNEFIVTPSGRTFISEDSASSAHPASSTLPAAKGNTGTEEKKSADPFTTTMSHAVKVIKGSNSPQREAKLIIIDGPLVGLEGRIIKNDSHKKMAILRSEFMHRQVDLKVPLQVVKTVEVA